MQVQGHAVGGHARREVSAREREQLQHIERQGLFRENAHHAECRPPQAERVLVAAGRVPDAEDAGERVELVGERDADRHRFLRQCAARSLGKVVLLDRGRNRRGFAVVARIVTAHDALQFRKLADHVGEQIGLGEHRGALRHGIVGPQQARDFAGQFLDAIDAPQLAAELVVVHDIGEARHAFLELRLAVLIEEKACIRKSCAQHALVTVNDVPRVRGLHVAHEQEIR
jgi:hypothetical protein